MRGAPAPLLDDVVADASVGAGQFSFSRTGSFIYLSGKTSLGTWPIAWLDSSGKPQPLLEAPAEYLDLRLSPDGSRLAFSTGNIQIYDWARQTMTRVTFTSELKAFPVWVPDGKHMVFRSAIPGNYALNWIRTDGAGEVRRLLESKNELRPYSFSPDGKWLAFSQQVRIRASIFGRCRSTPAIRNIPMAGKPELFLRTSLTRWNRHFRRMDGGLRMCLPSRGATYLYARFPRLSDRAAESGRFPAEEANSPSGPTMGGNFSIKVRTTASTGLPVQRKASPLAPQAAPMGGHATPGLAASWNLDLAPGGSGLRRYCRDLVRSAEVQSASRSWAGFFDEVRRRMPIGSDPSNSES